MTPAAYESYEHGYFSLGGRKRLSLVSTMDPGRSLMIRGEGAGGQSFRIIELSKDSTVQICGVQGSQEDPLPAGEPESLQQLPTIVGYMHLVPTGND
jgi:hypothetical protein